MKWVDLHCDTISELYLDWKNGKKADLLQNDKMIDLYRLENCGYILQNFALFVDKARIHDTPFRQVCHLLTFFKQQIRMNSDRITVASDWDEIEHNQSLGKMSAVLTVEEGGVCEGKLENLYTLYDEGVRMMTLTWNYPNELGYPNYNENGDMDIPDTKRGLTRLGMEFIREMERLGIIIDVSHLSDAGFYDVANFAKKPFVASHSNARAVCPVVRNLTDDMIRRLAECGGIMGLNFSVDFLRLHAGGEQVDARNPQNWGLGYASAEDIAKHAVHIARVGGIESVAIGSDFDGIPAHPEISGVEDMEKLLDAFQKAGFHESEIDKICYKNALRVYRDVLS